MCSIEEAWAGQLFDGHPVQSQADLHIKYMPICDNLLSPNNYSGCYSKPQQRIKGMNTQTTAKQTLQQIQPGNNSNNNNNSNGVIRSQTRKNNNNNKNNNKINSNSNSKTTSTNSTQYPIPSFSQHNTFEKFAQISNNTDNTLDNNTDNTLDDNNNNNDDDYDNNDLLNEDNEDERTIIQKKFNNISMTNYNNQDVKALQNNNLANQTNDIETNTLLNDINKRLIKLEHDVHTTKTRNLYDMILFIIMGILLAFIIHAIMHK